MLKERPMKKVLLITSLLLAATSVSADEIKSALDEGMSAYKRGELGTAASQWEYAAQLARQAKASKVETLFPKPLSGWTMEAANTTANAAFGGGINVSRQYLKDEDSIQIEIIMDSPMLQGVIGLIGNPQFAAMSGMKIKRIKGQQASVESSEGHAKVQIVVGNNVLVSLEGQPEAALMSYAEAFNYEGIASLK